MMWIKQKQVPHVFSALSNVLICLLMYEHPATESQVAHPCSITTAAGDSWLPRFDSERGCCRMGRTAVYVVAHINALTRRGISSRSSHIRTRFLLPINPSYVTGVQLLSSSKKNVASTVLSSFSKFLQNYSCFSYLETFSA